MVRLFSAADYPHLIENGRRARPPNQLHRQSDYQHGEDLRAKPYTLFRIRVDAQPVLLR
jgi:hypothetical protein